MKANPEKLSDNSLQTTITLARDDSQNLQAKAEDLILEA
jgi:hypothetical protein